jgi:hypothetical protein
MIVGMTLFHGITNLSVTASKIRRKINQDPPHEWWRCCFPRAALTTFGAVRDTWWLSFICLALWASFGTYRHSVLSFATCASFKMEMRGYRKTPRVFSTRVVTGLVEVLLPSIAESAQFPSELLGKSITTVSSGSWFLSIQERPQPDLYRRE